MCCEIHICNGNGGDLQETENIIGSLLPSKCVKTYIESGDLHSRLVLRFNNVKGFDEQKYRYITAYACGIVLRNRTILRNVDKTIKSTRPRLDEASRRTVDSRIAHMYSIKYNDYDSITDMLYMFLQGSDSVDLEGFSEFRMKSIYNDISRWTSQIIEDVKMENEYEKFISLISGIVEDEEETEIRNQVVVHFIVQENDTYLLMEELDSLPEATKVIRRSDIMRELFKLEPDYIIIHDKLKRLDNSLYREMCDSFGRVFYCADS